MVVPLVIIHFDGIFQYNNHPFWGTPILGSHHMGESTQGLATGEGSDVVTAVNAWTVHGHGDASILFGSPPTTELTQVIGIRTNHSRDRIQMCSILDWKAPP